MRLLITPLAAVDLEESVITLHKTIRFGPELSLLSCVHIAKRFVSTLRAIGGDPSCLMNCALARMATT
jgi:hypothetical protein